MLWKAFLLYPMSTSVLALTRKRAVKCPFFLYVLDGLWCIISFLLFLYSFFTFRHSSVYILSFSLISHSILLSVWLCIIWVSLLQTLMFSSPIFLPLFFPQPSVIPLLYRFRLDHQRLPGPPGDWVLPVRSSSYLFFLTLHPPSLNFPFLFSAHQVPTFWCSIPFPCLLDVSSASISLFSNPP